MLNIDVKKKINTDIIALLKFKYIFLVVYMAILVKCIILVGVITITNNIVVMYIIHKETITKIRR